MMTVAWVCEILCRPRTKSNNHPSVSRSNRKYPSSTMFFFVLLSLGFFDKRASDQLRVKRRMRKYTCLRIIRSEFLLPFSAPLLPTPSPTCRQRGEHNNLPLMKLSDEWNSLPLSLGVTHVTPLAWHFTDSFHDILCKQSSMAISATTTNESITEAVCM